MYVDVNLDQGGRPTARSSVISRTSNPDFQPGLLRPWISPKNGKAYVTVNRYNPKTGVVEKRHELATNAPVALPRDSWKLIDRTITRAALQPLTFVSQVRGSGLERNIPDAFGTLAVESRTGGDITGATVSMSGNRRGDFDVAEEDVQLIPLPIIHKDFQFEAREIAVSRRAGAPLDTTTGTLAGRKVAEEIEKMFLGVSSNDGFSYAGGTIRGLTTHPDRLTKVLTSPVGNWGGAGPATLITEILAMIEQARVAGFFGPFRIIHSPGWAQYLGGDYSSNNGTGTVRQRVLATEGIQSMTQANYLTGMQFILVQMQPETIRAIVGMDVTTMMWETMGGMEVNFKVMAIIVPEVRADHAGNAGIVHGSA